MKISLNLTAATISILVIVISFIYVFKSKTFKVEVSEDTNNLIVNS